MYIFNTKKQTKTILLFVLLVSMVVVSCNNNPTKIVPISSLSFDNETIFLNLNDIRTLETTIEPINATNKDLKWSSSDESVATISENGEITAISEGQAIITVTTLDGGFSASCEVIVFFVTVFNVSNVEEWSRVLDFIQENGNGKTYEINILDIIDVGSISFGAIEKLVVNINGNNMLSGCIIVMYHQHVLVKDASLVWVNVNGEGAVFTMDGDSSIKHFHDSGIKVMNNGTFIMLNGTISDNSAFEGGGVFVDSNATFIMKNGSIKDNTTQFAGHIEGQSGGGVHVRNGGTFNMYGGTIEGNYSHMIGGGVYIGNGSTFNMFGGIIDNNEARGAPFGGGGVFVDNNSFFNFIEGVISFNSAPGGAGVFILDSSFSMHGGVVSGNVGGGVALGFTSYFIMSGGIIYGSYASGVPKEFANEADKFSALTKSFNSVAIYSDLTGILPHFDEFSYQTEYTIEGK